MDLYAVCGFLLAALCINLLLRRISPEYAPLTVAASGILLAVYFLREAANTVETLSDLAAQYGLGGWFSLLLKALAIAVACQLTSALCRDCGESALAEKAELAGKLAILALTLPVVKQLLALL